MPHKVISPHDSFSQMREEAYWGGLFVLRHPMYRKAIWALCI